MIWDPFEDLGKMHEEMDRLFGKVLVKPLGIRALAKPSRVPVSELKETEKAMLAKIELPGIPKENIELNITEDSIEVRGALKKEKEEKKKGMYSYESSATQFYRKIPLPVEVKPDAAKAEFKDGLLKVEIPKARQVEHRKPKRIQIK
jgi:HSP20 family protein